MAVSITDVARKAGVSLSTVSYVLNGGPRNVTDELRERVLTIVRELDYRPSQIARSMVTGRTGAIGVIHAPIKYDVFGGTFVQVMMSGIMAEAQRLRHDLLIYANALTDDPKHAILDVDDGRADGWIVIASGRSDPLVDMLVETKKPLIIVTGTWRPEVSYVGGDNSNGVALQFKHLYDLGHRKIGEIYGNLDRTDAVERRNAFRRALKNHNLPFEKKWSVCGNFEPDKAFVAAQKLLSQHELPTALIVANDAMAIAAIDAAKSVGISVPNQLSVIGLDGLVTGLLSDPPLSTVVQPLPEMGAAAVRGLDSLIRGEKVVSSTRFPMKLVVRASTSSPKED
jgi:DNA-binding LacI/PurR family transcriptional regulator